MMKTSREVLSPILFVLLLALSCRAFKNLNSINDLKVLYVVRLRPVPMHSITLLHWFANNVIITNNNVIRLPFNPNGGFGSHRYNNYEGLLPSASSGHNYFTIGNVNFNQSSQGTCPLIQNLPDGVLYPLRVIERAEIRRNMDRIIVQTFNFNRISQMYLTQHYLNNNQGSGYDPDNTFSISTNLLQELRLFSFNNNRQSLQDLRTQFDQNIRDYELDDLINIWGTPGARLGLLYLIVAPQRINQVGVCTRWTQDVKITSEKNLAVNMSREWQNCETQQTLLKVITGDNGYAKIVWRNVTKDQLNDGVVVVLFRKQKDDGESFIYKQIKYSEGSYGTSVPLNERFQVSLHKASTWYWSPTLTEEICKGKQFQSPQAVSVEGFAQLRLVVKDTKACFSLFIKNSCDQWKTDFYNSWVGLYQSDEKANNEYLFWQWQWVIKFEQVLNYGEYKTFTYCTGTTVTAGLQARFMIQNYDEIARSPEWQ